MMNEWINSYAFQHSETAIFWVKSSVIALAATPAQLKHFLSPATTRSKSQKFTFEGCAASSAR